MNKIRDALREKRFRYLLIIIAAVLLVGFVVQAIPKVTLDISFNMLPDTAARGETVEWSASVQIQGTYLTYYIQAPWGTWSVGRQGSGHGATHFSGTFTIPDDAPLGRVRITLYTNDYHYTGSDSDYITIVDRDTTPPVILIAQPGSSWTQGANAYYSVSDSQSGVAWVKYAWSGSSSKPSTGWVTGSTSGYPTTTTSGLWYLHVEAQDNAGNTAWDYSGPFKIDTSPPQVTFSPSSRDWAETPVTVTVTVSDSHSGASSSIGYAWSSSTATPSTWSFATLSSGKATFTQSSYGQWYLHIKATDSAGNTTIAYGGPYRIKDMTPPTIVLSPTSCSWTNQDVTVSVTVSDASGISWKQYQVSTSTSKPSTWNTLGSSVLLTQEGMWYVHVQTSDTEGNSTWVYSGPYKLDKTAPTVYLSSQSRDWSQDPARVTVNASDNLSGVKTVEYSWSLSTQPGTWTACSNGSTLTQAADGAWYLHIRVTDNAGNVTITSSSGTFKVDNSGPTVTFSPSSSSWRNQPVGVTISVIDQLSGLREQYYAISSSATPGNESWAALSGAVTVSTDGVWYIHVKAVDNLGNQTIATGGPYRLDRGKPEVSFSPTSRDWQDADVYVRVTVSDALSGVQLSQYAWSASSTSPGSSWTDFSSGATITQTLDGSWYLYVKVRDVAGNETLVSAGPYKIDKSIPAISATPSSRDWGNDPVLVNVNVSDACSGIKQKFYLWTTSSSFPSTSVNWVPLEENSLVLMTEGTWYLHVWAEDNVSHIAQATFGPYRLDRSLPQVTFQPSSRDWSPANVDVKVSARDDISGLQSTLYSWTRSTDAPVSWAAFSNGTTLSQSQNGEWYLHVNITDKAGNQLRTYSGPYRIDKEAPTAPGVPQTTSPTNKTSQTWVWQPAVDNVSGIDHYEVSEDGKAPYSVGNQTTCVTSFSSDGYHSLSVRAVDKAGNISASSTGYVLVDTTKPTVTFSPQKRDWAPIPITVSVLISDNLTDIVSQEYAWSQSPEVPSVWRPLSSYTLTQSEEGNWYLHIRAVDGAGNVTLACGGPYQYDYVSPPELVHVPGWYYTTMPTFKWEMTDEDDSQAAFQVVVANADTGEVVFDSGQIYSRETSFTLPTSRSPDVPGPLVASGTYRFTVQVRVWDDIGIASNWSLPQQFNVLAFERPRIVKLVDPPAGQQEPDPNDPSTYLLVTDGMAEDDLPFIKAGAEVTVKVDSVGPVTEAIASFPYLETSATVPEPPRPDRASGSPVNTWTVRFWTEANKTKVPDGTIVKMRMFGAGSEGGSTELALPPYAAGLAKVVSSIYNQWFVILQGSLRSFLP